MSYNHVFYQIGHPEKMVKTVSPIIYTTNEALALTFYGTDAEADAAIAAYGETGRWGHRPKGI